MPREIIIAAIASFLIFFLAFAYEIYFPHTGGITKRVEITQGLGSRQIGELLKNSGAIRSKWAFVIYVSFRGEASFLKPGVYSFGNESIPNIAGDLVNGSNRERTITIPEGWTIEEIKNYLEHEGFITEKKFDPPVNRFYYLAEIPKGLGLEGYLFPDTYRVFQDASFETIAIKMLENFDKKLMPDLRQEISRQGKTIPEIITMASLIEKEVVSDEDRAIVSGILWKRLNTGIALQVDATIVYIKKQEAIPRSTAGIPAAEGGLGRSKSFGGRASEISIADTKIDSPYNTYKNRGLPVGPISNPGLSSIKAAVYPQKSPYLYYLSAKDRKTIFSKTLEEHNAAKAKHLR